MTRRSLLGAGKTPSGKVDGMSREVTEAHYLHERSGLEPVLQAPVSNPTALKWVPGRDQLIAATRDGDLVEVDPVLGTRVIAEELGETAVLDIHRDRSRYLAVSRTGNWRVGTLKGELLFEGEHKFLSGMMGLMADKHAVLVGDEADHRVLKVISLQARKVTGTVRLPPRVICVLAEKTRRPLLARSTAAGLSVVPLGKEAKFPPGLESTAHRLRPAGDYVLGFTATGICVWGQQGGVPRSMRLPDLTAGDIGRAGQYLGLGMRNGAVALARMDRMEKRVRPDLVRAFDGPVTSVAFSSKGRWLATGAEGLRLWGWEE